MTLDEKKRLKSRTDNAQCFLIFMGLCGDVEKTSIALDLEPEFIHWLADTEGWNEKIRRVSLMSKSERPGDFERAANRCLVYVQAHQLRALLDTMLRELKALSPDDLMERCEVLDKQGKRHLTGKLFTDLATAIESTARISFMALNDTVSERLNRDENSGAQHTKASDLHASVIAALQTYGEDSAKILLREQAGLVKQLSDSGEAASMPSENPSAEVPTPQCAEVCQSVTPAQ